MSSAKKVISQPAPGQAYGKAATPWEDPEFESSYPTLHGYMSQTTWPDGKPRQTATLTVYTEHGCLTVVLNDRANLRSAFVNESSLFSALIKLEMALESDTVEWKGRRTEYNPAARTPF